MKSGMPKKRRKVRAFGTLITELLIPYRAP
jgi:hypothetical protein